MLRDEVTGEGDDLDKIKVAVQILTAEGPPPETPGVYQKTPLRDKVEYAIGLIDAGHHSKGKAIEFLRKVDSHLQQKHPQDEECRVMLELIKPVLEEYGSYHLSEQEDE
jgi:hypothetical protein